MATDKSPNKSLSLNDFILPIIILLTSTLVSGTIFYVSRDIRGDSESSVEYDCDSSEPLTTDCFRQYADELGLKMSKFNKCIEKRETEDIVASEIETGNTLEIQGTPSLYLGKGEGDEFKGFYLGAALNYKDLKEMLDYANENTLEQALDFYQVKQKELLEDFEAQVKVFYQSSQGGELKGKELKEKVSEVITQREADIARFGVLKDLRVGNGEVFGEGEVVLLEYSDYECPFCQQFAQKTIKLLKDDYFGAGKARYVFRDFPLESTHPNARAAAEAARCAGEQDMYFEYHDVLFGIN